MNTINFDRHNTPNPFLGNENQTRFIQTLLERIQTLFNTQEGLIGHAEQIQQQLNRLSTPRNMQGRSGEEMIRVIRISKLCREELVKAVREAKSRNFQFSGKFIHFKLLNDQVRI